jgi:putative transposase
VAEHLRRLYGVQVSADTVSRVTDAVLDDIAAWRSRPLEAVYPIVYFDALHVKVTEDRSVTTRACYLAVGVSCDGDREALGIWWQDKRAPSSGSPCSTTCTAAASATS